MKRLIALLMIMVLVFAVGCSSESNEPTKVAEAEPQAVVEESTEAPEHEVEEIPLFNIGDTVEIGGWTITVNGFRFDDGDGGYFTPDEGQKWIIIDSTITNNGAEQEILSSMMMFGLVDSEFYEKNMAFGPDLNGSLDGDLGPGRTMRGEIAYDVGVDETEWEFIFQPGFWEDGQAIYIIK